MISGGQQNPRYHQLANVIEGTEQAIECHVTIPRTSKSVELDGALGLELSLTSRSNLSDLPPTVVSLARLPIDRMPKPEAETKQG
jgi:hypothetical protein